MNLALSQAQLIAVLLASVRAAAWLAVCPPFNGPMMPGPVKGLLSIAMALPIAGQLSGQVTGLDTSNGGALLLASIEQVVVGAALGFITSLFFAAAQAAGDLIEVFGRFYHIVALTLLFATDGYRLVIRGFLQSYQTLPLTGTLSLGTLDKLLTHGLAQMFVAAIQIAGPLLAVLFCTDLALGLLNKAAPALNAFSMGFPAKIILVLTLGGMAIALLPKAIHALLIPAVEAVVTVSGG
jgi:flagellar biosynthetic protein FliR